MERAFPAMQAHGEHLLPMVQTLLDETGHRLADCTGIAVACGPGSFTGLRIACGAAQGLAFGSGLPVAGVGSLEAMAEASGGERVFACLDARMHEVYWAHYLRVGQNWQAVTEPQVGPPSSVALPAEGDWLGVGSGLAAYPELLAGMGSRLHYRDPLSPPLAGAVARLAAGRWIELAGAPETLQPLYVRNKVALTTEERAREGWR